MLHYLALQAAREGQASFAHVREIIKGLEKRGVDVTLYSPEYSSVYPSMLTRILSFIVIQLKLIMSRRPVRCLYIRSHFAAFPVALWGKLRSIPVVQELNGPFEDVYIAWPAMRKLCRLVEWLARKQLEWAQAVIVVTDELKQWVFQNSRRTGSVYVVPNGANVDLFHPAAPRTMELPEEYAVFFGSLAQYQGLDDLMSALGTEEWPESLKLVICGDGAMRTRVEEVAAEQERLVYPGKIPYQQLPGIIANSLVSISPQNNIGNRSNSGLSPLKVYESLACGAPVIVTDFPGQADLVRKENCGVVIPPNDPTAIAKAVRFLHTNREIAREMGKRGCQAICREHSWDSRAAQTYDIIHAIANRG